MSASIAAQGYLFSGSEPSARPPEVRDAAARRAPRRAAVELELCVLGSGSGGNSSAVRFGNEVILIDLGFGPRTIAFRLDQAKVNLADVRGVCLTHLDQDHFRPTWLPTLLGWRIKVYLHRWHVEDFSRLPGGEAMLTEGLVHVFNEEPFEPALGVRVSPIRLAHDIKGTSGFLVESAGGRLGYATDLGHVPDELVHRFGGVEVLALESNYDPPMQLRSSRPLFLKRRIMGQAGHLSNQQSFEAVCRILDRCPQGMNPRHIVLLHRSLQCNDPAIIREVFSKDERVRDRVTLSELRRRTKWFSAAPVATPRFKQMHLGF